MTGPLAGIRIVDLTTMISGPFATMLLGDQGADVIKIERADGGDQMRRFGRKSGTLTAPFVNNNRSKRSVAVDLKRAEGVEVVVRIVSTADVFVQNFRPGVVARLGLAEEVVRGLNPRLVYVSISGFGDKGPLAHKPAYDPIFQAASGLASVQGASDSARPRMVRAMLPDKIAALNAAQAISTALYAREKTDLICHPAPDARRAHRRGAVRSGLFGTEDCGAQVGEGDCLSTLPAPSTPLEKSNQADGRTPWI